MTKLSKLFVYLCLSALISAAAQAAAKIEVGAMEMDAEGPVDTLPGDIAYSGEDETTQEPKGAKNGEFVIAPLPSRSPLLGWTIALPVLYIYRPENLDKEDQSWTTGAGGFYTENDSYGAGLFHKTSVGREKGRPRIPS